jgi:ribonuclease HI
MDWISINTDSAVKHGVAGCGGVLRDHRGFWIKGFARNNGTTSAFIAELWGAYDGLCLARRSSFINIELQLDSMVVVKKEHMFRSMQIPLNTCKLLLERKSFLF